MQNKNNMNEQIKLLQQYLKSSPLGVSYNGNVDGYDSGPSFDKLTSAVNSLTTIIKEKLSQSTDQNLQEKAKTFAILNGKNVVIKIPELQIIINSLLKTKNDEQPTQSLDYIKNIQNIINSNPFGITYSGPKDGIINDELIQKLTEIENRIKEISGANISGKIISGGKISTDASDLSNTFVLIKKYMEFIKNKS